MNNMVFTLRDGHSDFNTKVPVAISVNTSCIQIEVESYNNCSASDDQVIGLGNKSIIMIELWEGELRSVHWADIRQEDPTHVIDYAEAEVRNRTEENGEPDEA